MLKLLDGFVRPLKNIVNPTDTTLSLDDTISMCALVSGGNHAYIMLSDNVSQEWVKVTGCTGSTLNMVRGQLGTVAQYFALGCAASGYHSQIVCELIAQGGCGATASCTPVSLATSNIPDAVIEKPYLGVIAFSNAVSVAAVVVPPWATATNSGGVMLIQGTPPIGSTDAYLSIMANGCANSISLLNEKVKVCQQVGV